MQEEVRRPHSGPQRAFSVLDRLLLTHPVWLQLSLNRDSALYILLREPVGTFLVRKCGFSHRKLLCLRATKERSPASIRELFICEEDSTFSLESSALSFPDLCRLVAFYCISRDVLPFPLQLPEVIARATSHRQLEAISHMGQEFWNASSPTENGSVDQSEEFGPKGQLVPAVAPALDLLGGPLKQGKLCFINPLFLQLELPQSQQALQTLQALQTQQQQSSHGGASTKRLRFKRSMRVRLSTDGSMHLSMEGGGSSASSSPSRTPERPGPPEERLPQRKVHAGAGPLRRSPAVSPASLEDEELPPARAPQAAGEPVPPQQEPSVEAAVLGLDAVPTPSLAELDSSSSFSSLDEEPDQDASPPADDASASLEGFLLPPSTSTSSSPSLLQAAAPHRPPLMRSGCRGGLQRMSAAFVCFFAPEKRVTRLVEELSRDRRSAFGAMVQDFLQTQREELRRLASPSSSAGAAGGSVEVLQGLRLFLTQAKSCLLDSGELEPPIQTLVPESEQDLAMERAMFSSVLRPLKKLLDNTLVALHRLDGSSQRLAQDLLRVKGGGLERLGIRAPSGAAYDREVERVRQKLDMMQRSHSPIDKVLLLLQACKCVHKAMGSLHRQEVSWEDFLPSLTHVIVECNRPHILLEVEYMMELLEPSWLCGEGGYYLSSVYASLCLIQSLEAKAPRPPGCLTREAQEELREWGRRRGREAQIHRESQRIQRCVRILFQDGEQSAVRTLQWQAGDSAPALAQLCADAFGVPDAGRYALYWRSGGEMRPLPPHARPQDLAGHSEGGPSLSYLRTDHDFSKMRRLTRGGAVDLSESVCEE
ncbi:unnamed protein product [Gadus morhua 'NCC']